MTKCSFIRSTFGHPDFLNGRNASLTFIVGRSDDLWLEDAVRKEANEHGDIVQAGLEKIYSMAFEIYNLLYFSCDTYELQYKH